MKQPVCPVNPYGSTGPRTEAGKERSSRNAIKTGLYSTTDLILDDAEAEIYNDLRLDLWNQLSPQGTLEETFAAEAVNATWRLRRCRLLEATFTDPGCASPEEIEKQQKSVDRARAQAHRHLARSLAELRRLQTEFAARLQLQTEGLFINPEAGLIDSRQFVATLHSWHKHRFDLLEKQPLPAPSQMPDTSFCKPAAKASAEPVTTPRNALCPCNSGVKFKRCCGKNAPPVLNMAA